MQQIKNQVWKTAIQSFQRRFQYTQFRLKYVGLIGFVGYPLYYFIWNDWFPQPYENMTLRIIASILSVPLMLRDYWPKALKPYMPIYTYIALFYALSFLFTYMLFRNDANVVWLVSAMMAFFFMILLIDWLNVIIMYVCGSLLAYAAFVISTNQAELPINYLMTLPVFILALLGGALFNYSEVLIDNEKQNAMLAMSANLAHEMRTPLLSIKSGAIGVEKFLPILLEVYEKHITQEQASSPIRPKNRELLKGALNRMKNEVDYANTLIDMLLMNLSKQSISTVDFSIFSVSDCVNAAINRYPFKENQRSKVQVVGSDDFECFGSNILLTNVIYNLLKNALYAITKSNKGYITIIIKSGDDANYILFKDTALGIHKTQLNHIFDDFYTTKGTSGTGLGLAFCKKVMEAFGGEIDCESREFEYTLFSLQFPKIEQELHEKSHAKVTSSPKVQQDNFSKV